MFITTDDAGSNALPNSARYCMEGKTAAVVCPGDSGIYGMAALIYELRGESPSLKSKLFLASLPQQRSRDTWSTADHDFAVISLSTA